MNKFILIVPSMDNDNFFINKNYIENIKNFNIPYYISDYNIKNINFNNLCGILLTGGGDIEPTFYNQEKQKETNNIHIERDMFEISLLKEALKRKIPTLAICRGIQIMNVAFNGSIKQHIPNHSQKEDKSKKTHYITIKNNTLLHKIINKNIIEVNSLHHQAVDKLANNFKVSALNNDIVEAIEYNDNNLFFLGLQWHPEALFDAHSKNIFSYFLNSIK